MNSSQALHQVFPRKAWWDGVSEIGSWKNIIYIYIYTLWQTNLAGWHIPSFNRGPCSIAMLDNQSADIYKYIYTFRGNEKKRTIGFSNENPLAVPFGSVNMKRKWREWPETAATSQLPSCQPSCAKLLLHHNTLQASILSWRMPKRLTILTMQ